MSTQEWSRSIGDRGDPPNRFHKVSSTMAKPLSSNPRAAMLSCSHKRFPCFRNRTNHPLRAPIRCEAFATDRTKQDQASRRKEEEATCAAKFVASMANHDTMDERAVRLLEGAVESKKVEPNLVTGALLFLEKSCQAEACPQRLEDVHGKWKLVFSTATNIKAFQYIPVPEYLTHHVGTGGVSLTSQLGPLGFDIIGCVGSWQKNAMEFSWDRMEVFFLGSKVWSTKLSTSRKTYKYFFKNNKILCARSSAGGITLLEAAC